MFWVDWMRFKIPQVPSSQELLDAAFKTVRKQTPRFGKRIRKKERFAKEIEKNKIEQVATLLGDRLKAISDSFPSFDSLGSFERELIDATIDLGETKTKLARLKKAAKIIWHIKSQSIRDVFESRQVSRIRKRSQSFYGRTSSVLKKLAKDLSALELKRKQLVELPRIQTDCFTVVIAGFPNVGKTTLLKALTESSPRIAPYPFTTQGLKIGFLEEGFIRVQVIDTPGLLDRPLSEKNPIEKKAVTALRYLGDTVLFVVDSSLASGFSLEQQQHLFSQVQSLFKNKKTIIVFSKTDLATREQTNEAHTRFEHAIPTTQVSELKQILLKHAKEKLKQTAALSQ